MEKVIGTILITSRIKKVLVEYKLFFTENSAIAIEIGEVPDLKSFFSYYLSPLATMPLAGFLVGLEEGKEFTKMIDIWERVVKEVNTKHISIVSYSDELSEDLLKLKSISIPYDKVKSVEFRKATRENVDPIKAQYLMVLSMGMLSSEFFMIPEASLKEVAELVRRTPLAGKLRGQYV